MQNNELRYVHTDNIHNFKAATIVVPFLLSLLKPGSVADVGCGTGTWLKVFGDQGISDLLGVDGAYVDKEKLHIAKSNFKEYDLETPYRPEKRYDLVISLEVAEHLKESSANIFVKTLTEISDTVVFSAAIPNQGGQNHINEQPPQYWIEKFEKLGYTCHDVLRPVFWENPQIDWWYRQNMLLLTKNAEISDRLLAMSSFSGTHLVHPSVLKMRQNAVNRLKGIMEGKKGIRMYAELLFKSISNKFR